MKTNNKKSKTIVIGITGGLACGKSKTAKIIHQLTDAPIIDADKIGHDLMNPKSTCWRKIAGVFGKNILKSDRSIDRKILGGIVFSSPNKLKKLEKILHPAIKSEIKRQIAYYKKMGYKMIILDAPLIIETNLLHLINKLIVVSVSKTLQIKRYADNDKNKKLLAKKIIAAQMPLKEKIKFADFHIKNNLSKTTLKNTIKIHLTSFQNKYILRGKQLVGSQP
ncbi:MAG: dephospho-CoA kinase [bacterium]